MEQEEPQAALYDFLYRDSSRIASYYAQLFSGRLTSLEEQDASTDSIEKRGGLSIQIASGDLKTGQADVVTHKRIIDPHDVVTTDVLSHLIATNRISNDVEGAAHGSLFIASGTLVFCDRFMMEMAAASLGLIKAKTAEERAAVQGLKWMKEVLARVEFPSAYILRTDNGELIGGTIKEAGMEEPISTYYFRHGTEGLPNVYMIGIKEVPTASFKIPGEQFFAAMQQAAHFLSTMLLPPGCIKATPLTFFRSL